MQINNKKRELIKNTLLTNMSVLEDMLGGNSEMKRKAIQLNIETLKLGWIHIALVGQTSCGKSTVINAMSEDIVVPENPMTATPIPTYIAKSVVDADTQRVTVIPEDEKKKSKELTRKEFLTQFCYNVEDQSGDNPKRLRFKEDRFAVVHTKGELFDKGAVLLDTLGSGATEFDNIKTSTILRGNVDVLIYIVGTNMLTASDIAFLQCYILGYTPKETEIKKMNYGVGNPIITPDKLIILGNDKTGILRGGLVESVKRIFKSNDCKLSDAEIAKFCENNVWIANALYGRLDGAGFYDYVENAPVGSDDIYLDDACGLNRKQKRYMYEIEDKEKAALADIEKWKKFKGHISTVCDNCFDDRSDFIKNKCYKIIADFNESKQIFEKTIKELSGNLGNIKSRIEKLERISVGVGSMIDKIPEDTDNMSEKMVKCVNSCLNDDIETILMELYSELISEKLGKMDTPPSNLPSFSSVKKMTDAERLRTLEPIIKPIISDLLSQCGYKVTNYLWGLAGSESEDITDDVPVKHYRTVMNYLNGHINNLLGTVSQMKDADISIVGIVLPSRDDLTKIGNDIEARIMKAIESSFDAMADTKNWASVFNVSIASVLKEGFFRKIANWFNGGVSNQQFWDKIRNDLIPKITLKMGADAVQSIESSIRPSVNTAYSFVEHSIRDIYVQCKYDCDAAIKKMKELDEVGAIEELIKGLEVKIKKCNKSIAEIDSVLKS